MEAGIQNASVFIAATPSDETNSSPVPLQNTLTSTRKVSTASRAFADYEPRPT